MQLALSPELDARLREGFPPGTPETRLSDALLQQGFAVMAPCPDDRSIRGAAFSQKRGGVLSYPMTANVLWKVNPDGQIMWTEGFVAFTGL